MYEGTLTNADGTTEPVAVKTLAPGASPAEHAQFAKEFDLQRRGCAHCKGVAVVYGCGKKGNALLIVMRRYVKSVKDHMELPLDAPLNSVRPPLPVGEAMLMLVQIAGNIRELHAANIRMQDLKPGNLLIDGKGDIFLSDFGLAHLIVQTMPQTAATSGGGTPNYSAPELLDPDLGAPT